MVQRVIIVAAMMFTIKPKPSIVVNEMALNPPYAKAVAGVLIGDMNAHVLANPIPSINHVGSTPW